MEKLKAYLVIVTGSGYDSYFSYADRLFKKLEDAEKYKKAFDEKYLISQDDIFNIVPQDIFMSWEYDEEKESFVPNFKGYTLEQYNAQDERWSIAMNEYHPCEIKVMELEESFDGKI